LNCIVYSAYGVFGTRDLSEDLEDGGRKGLDTFYKIGRLWFWIECCWDADGK